MKVTCIEFEDKGQDFLYWYVNESGVVIDAQPLHWPVWNGVRITNMPSLKKGSHVSCRTLLADMGEIRYPVRELYDVAPVHVEVKEFCKTYTTNTIHSKQSSNTC